MKMEGLKNNTLQGLWNWYTEQVQAQYSQQEARAIGRLVFEEVLGVSATQFAIERDMRMSESQIVSLWKVIKKLNAHVPVQYILGKAWFRELVLRVDEGVLIPRSETEELVQWVLDDSKNVSEKEPVRIWDIGTGSGCIALSLAKEMKNTQVWASDFSEAALTVAVNNAADNHLSVNFFKHDILSDALPQEKFHCVVSNPPYVRIQEKPLMLRNVLEYEPHSALFVPDEDPLLYYRAIAGVANRVLVPGGALYVEINEVLGPQTAELFSSQGFQNVEIRQDMQGKDRFVKGVYK